jgi:hypothetical protein
VFVLFTDLMGELLAALGAWVTSPFKVSYDVCLLGLLCLLHSASSALFCFCLFQLKRPPSERSFLTARCSPAFSFRALEQSF